MVEDEMKKNNGKRAGLASSVRQMAGQNLSGAEVKKISKQTGASTAQVFARAQKQGIGIGSGAVNKFNAGKLGVNLATQVAGPYGINYNPQADAKTAKALSQLGGMRNLKMQPNTSYMGYSQTGDQYNPIVLPKSILQGMSIGGQKSSGASPYSNLDIKFGGKAGEGPGPWASGYGFAGGSTTQPTTQPTTTPTDMQTEPMSVDQMKEASTGDSFFGFGGATSWRGSKKKKAKGIKSTVATSSSLRNSPNRIALGM